MYMQSYLLLADTFNFLSKLSEKMTLGKLLVLNVFYEKLLIQFYIFSGNSSIIELSSCQK